MVYIKSWYCGLGARVTLALVRFFLMLTYLYLYFGKITVKIMKNSRELYYINLRTIYIKTDFKKLELILYEFLDIYNLARYIKVLA